ncbi:MAG: ATP-binding protein [Gemmataceae bacterium]|nr:ATP-binding protein [Gemmataceae bacterium]
MRYKKSSTTSHFHCHCSAWSKTDNCSASATNLAILDLLVLDVIAAAHERSSVVLTTTLGFEQWNEVLGLARLTGAALDRLTHRCVIVESSGESYRLPDAKRRRRHELESTF